MRSITLLARSTILLVALLPACFCISPFLGPTASDSEIVYAESEPGVMIALHHFPTTEPNGGPPVILCHGIAAAGASFDVDPAHSMPLFLNRRGFDVWVMDMRGIGASSKPNPWWFDDFDCDANFENAIQHDIPAVIDKVTEITGKPKVFWAGHSMGGMLIYGYAGTIDQSRLAGLVIIGSPIDFKREHMGDVVSFGIDNAWLLDWLPYIPVEGSAWALAPIAGTKMSLQSFIWNQDNIEKPLARAIWAGGVGNMYRGVAQQFSGWITGEIPMYSSVDGSIDYGKSLGNISIPALVITGQVDVLGTPISVYEGYRRLSSEDKTFVVLSRSNGFGADYGHVDEYVGDNAAKFVFPLIGDWLEQRK
jgi:pimeloyl-ACP methyl ester carboxylesterase